MQVKDLFNLEDYSDFCYEIIVDGLMVVCDLKERYIVYNEINKYFIDYYRNCKKSTLLIYGGLSTYINRKIGDLK